MPADNLLRSYPAPPPKKISIYDFQRKGIHEQKQFYVNLTEEDRSNFKDRNKDINHLSHHLLAPPPPFILLQVLMTSKQKWHCAVPTHLNTTGPVSTILPTNVRQFSLLYAVQLIGSSGNLEKENINLYTVNYNRQDTSAKRASFLHHFT